eukprot:14988164-Alexandrium_andersonii.AAC.1
MTSAQAVAVAKKPGGLADKQRQVPKANSSAQAVVNAKMAAGGVSWFDSRKEGTPSNTHSNVSPGYPDVHAKGVHKGQGSAFAKGSPAEEEE